MTDNHFRHNDEAYTEQHYSQILRVTESGSARMLICFCIDISQSMSLILDGYREGRDYRVVDNRRRTEDGVSGIRSVEALPGRELLNRLAKLTDILCKMIVELKRQGDIADSVAICITTFSQFADVIQEFQDLRGISETYISRRLKIGTDSTNMATGLTFAEREIKKQQNILEQADIDTHTPMMVIMTDGLPTDGIAADRKRDAIRALSDEGKLNVIPVFIGGNDDRNSQRFLRGMTRESTLYTMSTDSEYDRVFEIIRTAIHNRTRYTVTDIPEQMEQAVETETNDAIDTTYGMVGNISITQGGTLEEMMEWEF